MKTKFNPFSAMTMRRVLTVATASLIAAALTSRVATQDSRAAPRTDSPNRFQKDFAAYVSPTGKLSLPKDYKKNWVHLGSWAVAKKEGENVSEIHVVYTQPETVAYYNRYGDYPDGAFLVKEVRAAKTHSLTTGFAASESDIKIWFLMIRDRKGRFAGNPNWKEGWGWGLYAVTAPAKNISEGFSKSCKDCHTPQKGDRWVYSYGYPALKQKF